VICGYIHSFLHYSFFRQLFKPPQSGGVLNPKGIKYKKMNGNEIDKVLYYMFDNDINEEKFYVYIFRYDNQNINKIIRFDYFNEEETLVYTIEDENNNYKITENMKIKLK
jgi:hypothetical protein